MNRLILEDEINPPIGSVGGKAKGLFTLKSLESKLNGYGFIALHSKVEIPPFFVVPAEMDLVNHHSQILKQAKLTGERYAVRSSSQLEDYGEHSFDGIFETCLDVSIEDLVRKICMVRKSVKSKKAIDYSVDVNIKLEKSMPVIVQSMVKGKESGVVYSKFPCPREILKIIRERKSLEREREINAFLRERREDGSLYLDSSSPVILSRDWGYMEDKITAIGLTALIIEEEIKHPIIMEFSYGEGCNSDEKFTIYPLQIRRLTRLSESKKFQMPELQDEGIIASTYDLNGAGEFSGKAFFVSSSDLGFINVSGLRIFDSQHPEGYVLVTPYLQFYDTSLDSITPNKKAVLAYTDLGRHHDMEISRKKGILYLNIYSSLGHTFYTNQNYKFKESPIKTGENIKVVSDGERGFVFNLSKKLK